MVTRKEVAQRAGVSEAVVSYVLNNRKIVKEETRRRVLEAMQELGYRPNQTARSLKTKRTMQLTVLVHYLGNPFEAGLLLHMESQARMRGYTIFFHTFVQEEEELLLELLKGRADGLLLLGQTLQAKSVEYCRSAGIPILSVTRPVGTLKAMPPFLDIDWVDGYRRLIRHLRSQGHDRIAFMTNGLPRSPIGYRLECFLEAMRNEGLELAEQHILDGRGRLEQASERMAAWIGAGLTFTAIVCGNDLMAIGCLAACRAAGMAVPRELAIAGSEDILMSSQTSPSLTTLHFPRPMLARLAVDRLLDMISTNFHGDSAAIDYGESQASPCIVLEADLVVRESTEYR